jgi:hypothetical protein
MTRDGEVDSDVNPALWQIGWNWLYVFVGAPILGIILGYMLGGGLGWAIGLLAFFGGPVVAVAGLVYVHMNKSDALEDGTVVVKREASEVARLDGDDNEMYSLATNIGDSLPLLPSPKRAVATLVVGDSLLLVHDSAAVDLPSLSWSVGDSTNEFYYDQVSGVNYNPNDSDDGGTFWVNLSDGHGQSWDTVTDAKDALSAVQDRVRAYKSR